MIQVAKQVGAVGLIAFAGYGFFQKASSNLTSPIRRAYRDVPSLSHCTGNARELHLTGDPGLCVKKGEYFSVIVDLKHNVDQQVFLCEEHYDQISKCDREWDNGGSGWQQLPFPRNRPDELSYRSYKA